MLNKSCVLFFWALFLVSVAASALPSGISIVASTPQGQSAIAPTKPQAPANSYCPDPSVLQLNRQGIYWFVGPSDQQKIWKSDGLSFVKHISRFLGAQWVGVNIGHIICLYKGEEKDTFPVALQEVHPATIKQPTGEQWVKDKLGYRRCYSDKATDCPFVIKPQQQIKNIYQQIAYQAKPAN